MKINKLLILIFIMNNLAWAQQGNPVQSQGKPGISQAPVEPPPPRTEKVFFSKPDCPFNDPSEDKFKDYTEGLKSYFVNLEKKESQCKQALGSGDWNNVQLAMGRYRQLMGLGAGNTSISGDFSVGGMPGGGGAQYFGGSFSASSTGAQLTCFNADEYYKNQADTFIIQNQSQTSSTTSSMTTSTSSNFSTCSGMTGDALINCVENARIAAVAFQKKTCRETASYQKEKAELDASLKTIEKSAGILKTMITDTDCRKEMPTATMQNAISLATEVASLSTPGIGGVFVGAIGSLIGTLVDSMKMKSAATQALESQAEVDHFKSVACLFTSFQSDIYDCSNKESVTYINKINSCYELGMKTPETLGGALTAWFTEFNKKVPSSNNPKEKINIATFLNENPIGKTQPKVTFNSIKNEAKKAGCTITENIIDSASAYTELKNNLECLANKNKYSESLSSVAGELPSSFEVAKLSSELKNKSEDLNFLQDLAIKNNQIPDDLREKYNCPSKDDLKGRDESLSLDKNNNEIITKKYNDLLNCLYSISKRNELKVEQNPVYYDLLSKEAIFQNQYIDPYLRHQVKNEVNQNIQDQYSFLIKAIKEDGAFKRHLEKMRKDADSNYRSRMNQHDQDPMTSILPLFKTCLHFNSMSFLDLSEFNADHEDAIKQNQQDPFADACKPFNCIIPKSNWVKDDRDKVDKLQALACTASNRANSYEQALVMKLNAIKESGQYKNLDDLCSNKK